MAYTYDPQKKAWSAKTLEPTGYLPNQYKATHDENPLKKITIDIIKSVPIRDPATGLLTGQFDYIPDREDKWVFDFKEAKNAVKANRVERIANAINAAKNKYNTQLNNLYNKIETIVKSLEANTYTKSNPYLSAKSEIEKIGEDIKKIIAEQKTIILKAGTLNATQLNKLIAPDEVEYSKNRVSLEQRNNKQKELNDSLQTEINDAVPEEYANTLIDKYVGPGGYFRTYYATEKVSPWNTASGAKTPADALGDRFDAQYYLKNEKSGIAADAAYDQAVRDDNLDILGRYDRNSYALWNYTYVGKPAGERGSPVSPTAEDAVKQTKEYKEEIPEKTDTIYTTVRDKVFGLEENVEKNKIAENAKNYQLRDLNQKLTNLVNDNKQVTEAWEAAKRQLLYAQQFPEEPKGNWVKLTESLKLDPKKLNDASYFGKVLVGALVKPAYLSSEEHKKILEENKNLVNELKEFQKQVKSLGNVEVYSTEIDQLFLDVAGKEEEKTIEKFGEMRKEVLEEAKNKLIQAQQKESSLSLMKNISGLNELENLQTNLQNSLLGDMDIGGMYGLTGKTDSTDPFKNYLKVDLGVDSVFGTKNGLIYNWEDWFFNQIEKKYSGGMDIPNDYVSPLYRTKAKGYVDAETIKSWKKYDDAYAALKINPNNIDAKNVLKTLPNDYIKVENRKEIKQSWLDFEAARLAAGFVDNKVLKEWEKYDQAYDVINSPVVNKNSEAYKQAATVYNSKPANYVPPNERVGFDVMLAQNFFTDYLKPRFDQSKSLSEFQSYLDVQKGEENIFQTEDRMTALKRAAETTLTTWFSNLQKLGPSSFNAAFYKDPIAYYKQFGVKDDKQIILDSTKFNDYVSEKYTRQKQNYDQARAAALANKTSKDFAGNDIDWNAWAYHYNLDLKKETDFAYLHYLVIGRNAPKLDANGNVVRDANGNIVKDAYDPAPDVFSPEINKIFLQTVLTPFLKKKMEQIGSVFGQFVRPEEFVDEFFKNLDPTKNQEEVSKLFDLYGLKETADLTELKQLMIEGLSGAQGEEIRNQVDNILAEGETPTQTKLGVDYIQREQETATGRETKTEATGLYKIFQNAGYKGTEDDFYQEFMPDATPEDIKLYAAATEPEKMKELFKIDLSGGPEKTLGQIYELMGEEPEDIYSMDAEQEIGTILSRMKEQARPSTASLKQDTKTDFGSLFKFELPEEREEVFSSKINTGSDFLSQYKTSLASSAFA